MSERVVAEMGKFARRPGLLLLFVLLIVLVGASQVGVHSRLNARVAEYESLRKGIMAAVDRGEVGPDEVRDQLKLIDEQIGLLSEDARMLAFPRSIQTGMQSLATIGSLFAALAAALAIGSEFGWGTYRNTIPLVRSRRGVLAGQFLGLLVLVLALVPIAAIFAIGVDLVLGDGISQGHAWPGVLIALVGTCLSLLLWSAVGLAAATFTRSPGAAATAVTMLWVVVAIASLVSEAIASWNVDAMTIRLMIQGGSKYLTALFAPAGVRTSQPPLVASFLILGALTAAVLAAAFTRFGESEIR